MTTDTNLTANDITYCFKTTDNVITTNVRVKQLNEQNEPKNIVIGYTKMQAKDTNCKDLVWHKELIFGEKWNASTKEFDHDVRLVLVEDQNEIDIIERISNEYLALDKNQMISNEKRFELKWKQ